MSDANQLEFPTTPPSDGSNGYVTWRQQREDTVNRLGQLSGLPLNHRVEVILKDGVRLRGMLRLREEKLFFDEKVARELDLVVDGVVFKPCEIDSCTRMD